MPKYRIAPQALVDICEIVDYVASDQPAAADRLAIRLLSAIKKLARFPKLGRARDDLRVGLRSFSVGNYIIYYAQTASVLDIVRVIHARRDEKSAFGDEDAPTDL